MEVRDFPNEHPYLYNASWILLAVVVAAGIGYVENARKTGDWSPVNYVSNVLHLEDYRN